MASLYKRQLKQGAVWYGQVKLRNGRWKGFNTHCTNRRAAKDVLREIQAEIGSGRDPFSDKTACGPYLSDLIQSYLAACLERLRPSTIRSYREALAKFVNCIGNVSVAAIDDGLIAKFKATVSAKSPYTQNIYLANVRAFLNWAKKQGTLGTWQPPAIQRIRTDPLPILHYYNQDECARLLQAAKNVTIKDRRTGIDFPLSHFLVVLMLTGLRKSEAAELRWEAPASSKVLWPWVDEEQAQIVIPAPIAKSRRARYVPIFSELQKVFDSWPLQKQGYLFPFSIASGKMTAKWDAVVKAAGVRRLKLHCLRDTFAIQLLLSGVPWAVVGEVLGHASVETTKRYYAAIGQPELRAAMERAAPKLTTVLLRD